MLQSYKDQFLRYPEDVRLFRYALRILNTGVTYTLYCGGGDGSGVLSFLNADEGTGLKAIWTVTELYQTDICRAVLPHWVTLTAQSWALLTKKFHYSIILCNGAFNQSLIDNKIDAFMALFASGPLIAIVRGHDLTEFELKNALMELNSGRENTYGAFDYIETAKLDVPTDPDKYSKTFSVCIVAEERIFGREIDDPRLKLRRVL